jgi:transposase-like protein
MALQCNDSSRLQRWLDWVRRWQKSRLSVRAFCLKHQLQEPSFYAWRRRLRERGLLDDAAVQAKEPTPAAFVQVLVDAQATAGAAGIEVVLGRGRRLVVRAGFDADTLRQLLRVLEEPAC